MGELQLEVLVDRMKREFNVLRQQGHPRLLIKKRLKRLDREKVNISVRPEAADSTDIVLSVLNRWAVAKVFEFKSEIKGGAIPNEYISPIEKGIKEKMENGVMAGFPMVDMRAVVYDGSFHEVDSSEIAFKIAVRWRLKMRLKIATRFFLSQS